MNIWVSTVAALVLAPAAAATPAKPAAPADTTVQTIVVTAKTLQSQTLVDRQVYVVSGDLQATSGVAADLLNKLPSVSVDADGNLALRGDSNVTVLVDGKPSAQFSGASRGLSLLQFPASEIERLEVLTDPPAQYKAEGSGGVINIVTKRNRKAGFSGGALATAGEQGRLNLALNGAYNTGKWNLSGGLGLRRDIKERRTTDARAVTDPASSAVTASRQVIDEHFRRLIPSVKIGVGYDLNDRQSLTGAVNWRQLSGKRYFDQHNESGPLGGGVSGISDRHSDGHEWNAAYDESLRFDQKLWRPDETLSLALQRSVEREREGYVYRNVSARPAAPQAFDDLHLSMDLVKTEFSADYDLPLSHDRELKAGYDLESDRNAFDNVGDTLDPVSRQPTLDPAVSNHFRYRQQVDAIYGQYQTPIGAWRLLGGLRLESAHISTLQITGNLPGGRDDLGLYPSLHLDRAIGDSGKIRASISRRITRPDPEALNPFADHQDIHNLRSGNPNLRPRDTWSYELGYQGVAGRLNYGATAYARFNKNAVTDVVRPISADVVLTTKANLPKSRLAGVEFTAGGDLFSQLSYNLSGNLFWNEIDAASLGFPGVKSTTGLDLKGNLDYHPTPRDSLQVAVTRSAKRLTPQGEYAAINLVNLGYKHQLSKDLSAVVTVTDLFDGQRQRRLIGAPLLHDVYERRQFGRIVAVGLIYSFGAPSKSKGFEYDQ